MCEREKVWSDGGTFQFGKERGSGKETTPAPQTDTEKRPCGQPFRQAESQHTERPETYPAKENSLLFRQNSLLFAGFESWIN